MNKDNGQGHLTVILPCTRQMNTPIITVNVIVARVSDDHKNHCHDLCNIQCFIMAAFSHLLNESISHKRQENNRDWIYPNDFSQKSNLKKVSGLSI